MATYRCRRLAAAEVASGPHRSHRRSLRQPTAAQPYRDACYGDVPEGCARGGRGFRPLGEPLCRLRLVPAHRPAAPDLLIRGDCGRVPAAWGEHVQGLDEDGAIRSDGAEEAAASCPGGLPAHRRLSGWSSLLVRLLRTAAGEGD